MILVIKDKIRDNKYVKGDILFINLISLITDMLIAAKLDLYYGVRPK